MRPGQKLLDRISNLSSIVADEEYMVRARKLEIACTRNVLGQKPSSLYVDERVFGSVNDEAGHADRWDNIADIDLADHVYEGGSSAWVGAKALELPPPALERRIVRARGCKHG